MSINKVATTFGLICFGLLMGTLISLVAGETYYRLATRDDFYTPGCRWVKDDEIGFVNPPNKVCRHRTPEFDYVFSLNSDGHPDDETRLYDNACIVMALGDSHTRALGVSNQDAWPDVVERSLREYDGRDWQVINMGVVGYNLGQELQLMNRYVDKYKPTHVMLAFSMATDAWDIRTPAQGGFVYGSSFARDYYDTEDGELLLRRHADRIASDGIASSKTANPTDAPVQNASLVLKLKEFLEGRSKLYPILKRGPIGRYVTSGLRRFGIIIWDSAEPVLAKDLSPTDALSWLLVERILDEFETRLNDRNIGFTVVILPYLPQVYDHVWNQSFAFDKDRYDRFAGNRKLMKICQEYEIDCLDLTQSFIDEVKARGSMLHFPIDAHPNVEGHLLIGQRAAEHLIPLLDKQCGTR